MDHLNWFPLWDRLKAHLERSSHIILPLPSTDVDQGVGGPAPLQVWVRDDTLVARVSEAYTEGAGLEADS